MEHSEHCKQAQETHKTETYDYVTRWPNHCRTCGGWGGFVWYDDPGARDCSLSGGLMEFYEPCSGCLEGGICPRCGEKVWDWDGPEGTDNQAVCPYCFWIEEETEGIRDMPECYCWYDEVEIPF